MRWISPLMLGTLVVLAGCGGASPTANPTTVPGATFPPELVRKPAVAGQFYPDDPAELAAMVDGFLQGHEPTPGRPIALIVPHAGYVYSGAVAGYAFAELRGQQYEAVVLIGVNHYLADFSGVAVYPDGAFQTPLGQVPVDTELTQAILQANPSFDDNPYWHSKEHSLEVELPFLQRVLPGTPIVPILIGQPTPQNTQALIEALSRVLPGHNVLLIASSDLSHYPAYDDAVEVDQATLAAIATMDVDRFRQAVGQEMARGVPNLVTTCCGEEAIAVVMEVAPKLGADHVTVLHYANSGDVPAGQRDQVVGYGAVKFWASK
jgi:AmmeMemoRadiSam system protein B